MFHLLRRTFVYLCRQTVCKNHKHRMAKIRGHPPRRAPAIKFGHSEYGEWVRCTQYMFGYTAVWLYAICVWIQLLFFVVYTYFLVDCCWVPPLHISTIHYDWSDFSRASRLLRSSIRGIGGATLQKRILIHIVQNVCGYVVIREELLYVHFV